MEAVTRLGLPAADREVERDGDHAEAEEKDDREGVHTVVKRAYQSCEQAVRNQIARLTSGGGPSESNEPEPTAREVVEVRTSPAITGASLNRIPSAQFTNQPTPPDLLPPVR